jgi:hypothetical protein
MAEVFYRKEAGKTLFEELASRISRCRGAVNPPKNTGPHGAP